MNMLRGLLAEFGIEIARGLHHALRLAGQLSTGEAPEAPPLARLVVKGLADQIGTIQVQLAVWRRSFWPGTAPTSCRSVWSRSRHRSDLGNRTGCFVVEPERFRSGRQVAASLGLSPSLQKLRETADDGPDLAEWGTRSCGLRTVVGMTSLVRRARTKLASVEPRLSAMLARKPARS